MLKEAIDRIAALAIGGEKVQIVRPPAEPAHVYLLVKPDQTVEKITAESPPRSEILLDVDSFAERVRSLSPDKKSVIYVGPNEVCAVLDDGGSRRDRLCLPLLPHTPQFCALRDIADRDLISQGAFINFLRIDLATAVPADIIALFRSLKGNRSSETRATVQVGKESLGRDVLAEVAASGKAIPETIVVTTPVYDLPDFPSAEIQCAVICDLMEMTFGLRPLAGQIRRAEIEAQRVIAGLIIIALAGYSVVLGEPTVR